MWWTKARRELARGFGVGVALALAASVSLGCQPQGSTTPTQGVASATGAAAAMQPLKLGIMVSLTGPGASAGVKLERLIRMGLDDINGKGGIKVAGTAYRLEAVTVDDLSTAEGGREAANRLVLSEKVKFILGPISVQTAGAQTVTEPNKVMIFAFNAVPKSLGTSFPLTFQALPALPTRVQVVYDWLAEEHASVKRIAMIAPDDANGRTATELSGTAARAKGIAVAATEYYLPDTKDFGPLVSRVLRQNPDAIDITLGGGRTPLLLGLVQAIGDQGYKGTVYGLSAEVSALRQVAPQIKTFSLVVYALSDPTASVVSKGEQDVLRRHAERYGAAETDPAVLSAYLIPLLLSQAMERAGTVEDTTKVAAAMRSEELDGMAGKTRFVGAKTFGLAVVPEQTAYLVKVEGGKVSTFKAMKATLP